MPVLRRLSILGVHDVKSLTYKKQIDRFVGGGFSNGDAPLFLFRGNRQLLHYQSLRPPRVRSGALALVPASFGLALSGRLGHLLNVGNCSVGTIEVTVDEAFVLSWGERGERIDVGRTALRVLLIKPNLVATNLAAQ